MKFVEYLKIMNCYFGIEKSQYEFMKEFFSLFVTEPFSDEDVRKDENDEYYPFSTLCAPDSVKRIFNGTRVLPKASARFMLSHYCQDKFDDALANKDEAILRNLSSDLWEYGIESHIDNIADVAASIFHDFLKAALDENDTIETGILGRTEIKVQSDIATLLLIETDNKCPLCGKSLNRKNKKKGSLSAYNVTQIFPEDIDIERYVRFSKQQKISSDYNSYENLIALCSECSAEYLSDPTDEEHSNLLKIKKALQQNHKLQQDLTDINLEEEIQYIVHGLVNINDTEKLVDLRMEALKISQKIERKNTLLIDTITHDVIRYYSYIEDLFADIDDQKTGTFTLIASEIRQAYLKISTQGASQDETFNLIEGWLRQRLDLENRHSMAVRIVVSFFVQNCEVFDEISE